MRNESRVRSDLISSLELAPTQAAMPPLPAVVAPAHPPGPRSYASAPSIPTPAIDLAAAGEDARRRKARAPRAGGWVSFVGNLAALGWVAGGVAVPVSFFGLTGILALHPALQAGMVAATFGPSFLILLGTAAAADAARARAFAARLTELAEDGHALSGPTETTAKRLGESVRQEIELLNAALDTALARMGALEAAASRNAGAFDDAIAATRDGAAVLNDNLERGREAFSALNVELRGHTETMAGAVGRQIRLMREASRLVRTEFTAADEAFRTQLEQFQSSSDEMRAHTNAFNDAAAQTHGASDRLTETIANALDTLTQATSLTDAARQSAEEATFAANTTAAAVRDTTQRAVQDAKRAAEMIRAEAAAMEEGAAVTLDRLRAAAEAARSASAEAQAAADKHAAAIERRISALAETSAPAAPRSAPARSAPPIASAPAAPSTGFNRLSGRGGWSNLTPPGLEGYADAGAALDAEFDALDTVGGPDLREAVMAALELAGVRPNEALSPAALDQISRHARQGAAPRRRAVVEVAGGSVSRLARALARNPANRAAAEAFRAQPELATDEAEARRLGYNPSALISAYLLVDAALG